MDLKTLESQPDHILFNIGLNLDYSDLITYCQLSKKFNKLCQNRTFWQQKGKNDFSLKRQDYPINAFEYYRLLMIHRCLPGAEKYINPTQCLEKAIQTQNLDLINYFIEISKPSSRLFKTAGLTGNLDIINLLLNRYQPFDPDIFQIAFGAAIAGHLDIINYLLSKYTTRSQQRDIKRHALTGASAGGHLEIIKQFFPSFLIFGNLLLRFRLMLREAVTGNRYDVTEYLLEIAKQRNIDIGEKFLTKLLIVAAQNGNLDLVKLLINSGANDLYHVLGVAANYQHYDIVDHLYRSGVNDPTKLAETLDFAAFYHDRKLIDWLYQHNVTDTNKGLAGAAAGGHLKLVHLFLNKGATDINKAFINASIYGRLPILNYLKSFNVIPIDVLNQALHRVIIFNRSNFALIISYLIDLGANDLLQMLLTAISEQTIDLSTLLTILQSHLSPPELTTLIDTLLYTILTQSPLQVDFETITEIIEFALKNCSPPCLSYVALKHTLNTIRDNTNIPPEIIDYLLTVTDHYS